MANGAQGWMAGIADDRSLSDIAMPGTHDSATYALDSFAYEAIRASGVLPFNPGASALEYVRCQSRTIREQLDLGIRFLDLRVNAVDDFRMYHGPVPLTIRLGDALDQVDAFLADHSSETVVVSIKQENDDDRSTTAAALKTFLDKRPHPPYAKPAVPTLKEARGRTVLVNRVFEKPAYGMFVHFDDNTIFDKDQEQGDKTATAPATKLRFAVQDVYNPSPGWFRSNLTCKIEKIGEGYRRFASGDYAFRIAFLSASTVPTRNPRDFAKAINADVWRYLADNAGGRPWITLIDFAGDFGSGATEPVAGIIATNRFDDIDLGKEKDTLLAGKSLAPGGRLVSASGAYEAVLQHDGNFVVIRRFDGFAMKATGTDNRGSTSVTLQDDGNFVVLAGSQPIAATMTQGKGVKRMTMQDDGNLVLYDGNNGAHWASRRDDFSH